MQLQLTRHHEHTVLGTAANQPHRQAGIPGDTLAAAPLTLAASPKALEQSRTDPRSSPTQTDTLQHLPAAEWRRGASITPLDSRLQRYRPGPICPPADNALIASNDRARAGPGTA